MRASAGILVVLIAVSACKTDEPSTLAQSPSGTLMELELLDGLTIENIGPIGGTTPCGRSYESVVDSGGYDYTPNGNDRRPVIEAILKQQDNRPYGPYENRLFQDVFTFYVDSVVIEHIVSRREAHCSGMADSTTVKQSDFSRDVANLTFATSYYNYEIKSHRDRRTFEPTYNDCWYVGVVVRVKHKWGLSVDEEEKEVLASVLEDCASTEMVIPPQDG